MATGTNITSIFCHHVVRPKHIPARETAAVNYVPARVENTRY